MYNPNISTTSFHTVRDVKVGVCAAVIVLCNFGLVGNLVSLLVLKRSKASSTTLWLKFLAIFDSMCLVFSCLKASFESTKERAHYTLYMIPPLHGFGLVSIWVVVFVSLERYIAVVHPFRVKSICTVFRVKIIVLFTALFLMSMQIPAFFELDVIQCIGSKSELMKICKYRHTDLFNSFTYQLLYRLTYRAMFRLILPVAIMTYSSMSLMKALNQRKRFLQRTSGYTSRSWKSTGSKNENTIMVVGVVIVLITSQLPLLVYITIDSTSIIAPTFYKNYHLFIFQNIAFDTVSIMTVLNSSVNFIIYVMTSKRFRDELQRMCMCFSKKQHTDAALRLRAISQINSRV